MRDQTDAEKDRTLGVTRRVPWTVTEVQVLPGHRMRVSFEDGTRGEVDVTRLVFGSDPGVFAALRDPAVFAQAHLVLGAVTWPGEIDLAPDAMYHEIKAHGTWVVE